MKYLILPMALISAFFVSAQEPDLSDLKSPKSEPTTTYECAFNNKHFFGRGTSIGDCQKYEDLIKALYPSSGSSSDGAQCTTSLTVNSQGEADIQYQITSQTAQPYGKDTICANSSFLGALRAQDEQTIISESCPPPSYPLHKIPVTQDGNLMCAKPLTEPEPDPNDKCDEFGNNSMLPPKSGVGSEGQNACYTNPSNGLSCQYVQGGDNFTATGKQCTGDENDYGDRPTPEPPPDGADPNCYNYGSQGQVLICDVDPNEGCNPLTINGTTQYQCPSGCGSIDDVYFCSYDDKDGDGIPDDKNGNGVPDKDETCVNGKCKPNTPDDTTPPTTEKPDMTETNTRLDGVIGELDSIGGKINKTNQTLNGINSGVQGIKQGQDKANGLLAGMSKDTGLIADNTDAIAGNTKGLLETVSKTDVGNTFNPDLSTGFYESSYENGFAGIWAEKSILFEQTETIQFLQQFRFNAGGSPPDTQLCFNMGGSMDFGCADLPTPSPQLLAILKIFILITAAFLCRALIFGG